MNKIIPYLAAVAAFTGAAFLVEGAKGGVLIEMQCVAKEAIIK